MKNIIRLLIPVVLVMLAIQPAFSAERMTLSSVSGLNENDEATVGVPVRFTFHVEHGWSNGRIVDFGNFFRVWTEDQYGALTSNFTPIIYDFLPLSGPDWYSRFDIYHNAATPGVDGLGADTVGFSAVAFFYNGFEEGFYQSVWWIETTPTVGAEGNYLCLDSVNHSPGFNFYWYSLNGGNIVPDCEIESRYLIAYICGDFDGQEGINILDIVYLINYKYKGGPAPVPMIAANINSDEQVNILDIVYLINYKYKGGPEPDCIEAPELTTAECGGNITSDGGAAVTARGVCWGTNPTPTLANNKTSDGTGIGSFTSSITALTAGTTYYVRAYATNNVSTGYGNEVSFTTLAILPELTTSAVTGITQTTAECGGTITSDGGASVTARGVCWGTDPIPTIADNTTSDGTGTGSFASSITYLVPNTTYYIRAYATNSVGTGYGNIESFTTLTIETGTVTDIDGNVYQTVKIGDQWWMAENLKVTHYRNGDPIPHVTNNTEWRNLSTGAYCEYNNDIANVETYGRLYNWHTINDSRNIAPAGWHVPTDEEWKQLEMYLGMSQSEADQVGLRGTDEGGKLKETGTTHWDSPNTGATNESGFTGLPGGSRSNIGNYGYMGGHASLWSSTEYSGTHAWDRTLSYDNSGVVRDWLYRFKENGFSVRCIKD